MRRVGHADESAIGHLEQTELARRPEAVLDRPQQPQGVMPLALERQHRVDGVLERPRPGERAVLGDVADEHDGDVAALGLDDSCWAHSRTWVVDPGDEDVRSSAIVWMLSMTTSSGATFSIASTTPRNDVSAAIQTSDGGSRAAPPGSSPAAGSPRR